MEDGGVRVQAVEVQTGKMGWVRKDVFFEGIVARGYDKFFNVGEVSWTQVSELLICKVVQS